MSRIQAQVLDRPWLKRPPVRRRLKTATLRMRRTIRVRTRKLKSMVLGFLRRQYYLTTAAADAQKAVRRNEDIFLASLLAVLGLGYCMASIAYEVLILFFKTAYDITAMTGISILLLAMLALTAITPLAGWIATFAFNTMSLALMDGMVLKKHRSVRSTWRRALRYAPRVTGTWALVLLIAFAPLLAVTSIAVSYIKSYEVPVEAVTEMLPAAAVMATAWITAVLLNYSLAPYVALFEPGLLQRETLKRSRQLVQRRGRLFLLSGYLLLGFVLLAMFNLALQAKRAFGFDHGIIFAFGTLITIIIANGIMVALYRKRKLARIN